MACRYSNSMALGGYAAYDMLWIQLLQIPQDPHLTVTLAVNGQPPGNRKTWREKYNCCVFISDAD